MKNKLFKGLFGCLLALCLFAVADVYAGDSYMEIINDREGFNVSGNTATVGEVETPVYEAQLVWPNLAFNWTYDANDKEFSWRASSTCEFYSDDYELAQYLMSNAGYVLYKDSSCNERASEEESVDAYYILSKTDAAEIVIIDNSQYGHIVPSVFWESSEEYEHVIGKLEYQVEKSVCSAIESQDMLDSAIELGVTIYDDSECSKATVENPTSLDKAYYVFRTFNAVVPVTGEIPEEAGINSFDYISEYNFTEDMNEYKTIGYYVVNLSLSNDPDKEAITPVSGDAIGTVTVSIRAR